MKKLKVYLDTSIVSHLDAPDVPDKEADTKRLWDRIKAGEFEAFISPVVIAEVDRCDEPKRSFMREELRSTPHTFLEETEEVRDLADRYIAADILRAKNLNDSQHVAYACVYNCDMVISWNFTHLVNYKTIAGVKSVNAMAGYKEMPIYPPSMFKEGDKEDEL